MYRILGIDPGSRITGYGIIDSDGRKSSYVGSGVIRSSNENFLERLIEIFLGIQEVATDFSPNQVAIEQVFLAQNPTSALKLGQARGVAVAAIAGTNSKMYEYSARTIKQSLVGNGSASKEQVQHMVSVLLSSPKTKSLDESDALAIALCHAHNIPIIKIKERKV